jgi:leader peptidase (prepilin peptidase)/N-methyltransferase
MTGGVPPFRGPRKLNVIGVDQVIRIIGTILGGLLGFAFGSFLNVCLSRWPEGESIVAPRSHCRNCGRTLAWWENIPIVSWITLRARCRTCTARISWRYPSVELGIGVLWSIVAWQSLGDSFEHLIVLANPYAAIAIVLLKLIFVWLLAALAILDAEHLWLPNRLTFAGIGLGIIRGVVALVSAGGLFISNHGPLVAATYWLAGVILPAGLILLIRWTYWLIRRREGIGLGDAKLMAMLGAWLGLSGALLSFAIGVGLGALFALVLLAIPAARRESNTWLAAKLPLGTFLCIGGIISTLWSQPIIAAYLHWAGF